MGVQRDPDRGDGEPADGRGPGRDGLGSTPAARTVDDRMARLVFQAMERSASPPPAAPDTGRDQGRAPPNDAPTGSDIPNLAEPPTPPFTTDARVGRDLSAAVPEAPNTTAPSAPIAHASGTASADPMPRRTDPEGPYGPFAHQVVTAIRRRQGRVAQRSADGGRSTDSTAQPEAGPISPRGPATARALTETARRRDPGGGERSELVNGQGGGRRRWREARIAAAIVLAAGAIALALHGFVEGRGSTTRQGGTASDPPPRTMPDEPAPGAARADRASDRAAPRSEPTRPDAAGQSAIEPRPRPWDGQDPRVATLARGDAARVPAVDGAFEIQEVPVFAPARSARRAAPADVPGPPAAAPAGAGAIANAAIPMPPEKPPAPPGRLSDPAAVASVETTAGDGRYTVQLAALRDQGTAESVWLILKEDLPGVLGDKALLLRAAEVTGKGLFWQVRTGPFPEKGAAEAVCVELKARGRDCFVVDEPAARRTR